MPDVVTATRVARTGSFDRAALVVFATVLVIALAVFGDYGVTADELVQDTYGRLVLGYYASLATDQAANHYYDLYYYGALFDVLARLIEPVLPYGPFETRHLLCALIGILGIVGTWRLGRELGGPRLGFAAAVTLVLIPYWFGQMFNNTKDIPFATFYVWALYYIARLVPLLPIPPWHLCLRLGLSIGLALGIRIGGVMLLVLYGLSVATILARRAWAKRDARWLRSASWQAFIAALLPSAASAYAVMLLFWPWAQQAPIMHPLQALLYFANIPVDYPVLYLGQEIPASHVPRSYAAISIAVRLPEPILLLAALGIGLAAISLWRALKGRDETLILPNLLPLSAAVLPIIYVAARDATLYDGFRHLTFVLPPLAILAAAAFWWTWDLLRGAAARAAPLLAAGIAGWMVFQASTMVRLHPDQYVYFNALVGGLPGAAHRFDLDYWSGSFREAVLDLDTKLRTEDGGHLPSHVRVGICGSAFPAVYYFRPYMVYAPEGQPADFVIALNRGDCLSRFGGRRYATIDRLGTPLSGVIDLRTTMHAATESAAWPPPP